MATHCPKLTTTKNDIMKKRHAKAMAQLEHDAKQEEFLLMQKHIQLNIAEATTTQEEQKDDQPKKRKRQEDITDEEPNLETCSYCQHLFEPDILPSHLKRCPQKLKALHQTTLQLK
jgi:hypothetical protein